MLHAKKKSGFYQINGRKNMIEKLKLWLEKTKVFSMEKLRFSLDNLDRKFHSGKYRSNKN